MQELFLIGLVIIYLLISPRFFSIWLEFLQADTSLTAPDKVSGVAIVVLATVFWPVVVPIAYWSLLKTQRISSKSKI